MEIRKYYKIVIFLLFFSGLIHANEIVIKYAKTSQVSERDSFQIDLLRFILDKSAKDYKIIPSKNLYTQSKIIKDLEIGKNINISWMGTSIELEKKFNAIYYPIYRGLLGHRIFIIHKDNKNKFSNIKSLDALRELKGAQGMGWSDIKILENAGLKQYSTKYENIFKMINLGNRIDYFSRGINEAYAEVTHRKAKLDNLFVEEKIVLVYPFAMYFFINPKEKELINIINEGFKKSYEDGSYLEFFYNHPKIKESIEKSNLKNRVKIEIENPFISEETKNIKSKYWHGVKR